MPSRVLSPLAWVKGLVVGGFFKFIFFSGVSFQHLTVITCPKAYIVLRWRRCWMCELSRSLNAKEREEEVPCT